MAEAYKVRSTGIESPFQDSADLEPSFCCLVLAGDLLGPSVFFPALG